MSTNVVNQMPYLRTTREFPEEVRGLAFQVNKSYLDVASAVNFRIIGLFPTNRPSITGERYFIRQNQEQQTFRQVYRFTNTTAINHGIQVIDPAQFTSCFGSYTDGTNSYGLVFGTSVAVAGLITFYITATQIIFVLGAGAPALTTGTIVLHWLSQP